MVLYDSKISDGSNCAALSYFLCASPISSTGDASNDVEVVYHTYELWVAAASPHRAAALPPVVAIDRDGPFHVSLRQLWHLLLHLHRHFTHR
jgi:hypothetical protein